jgi:hypothetical protein
MLADPRFMEAKPIEPLHQLQIAVHARGRVFIHRMKRRQEDAVAEVDLWHDAASRMGRRHCGLHLMTPQGGRDEPWHRRIVFDLCPAPLELIGDGR